MRIFHNMPPLLTDRYVYLNYIHRLHPFPYDLNFVSVFEKGSSSYLPTKSTPAFLKSLYPGVLKLKIP